jgi:hypothetical protein
MSRRWLTLLETHIEKGMLGLAAAFLVAMLYMCFIRSPNVVKFEKQELGPRELLAAIKSDADDLDRKVRSASAEEPQVEDFSEQLRAQHAKGIFASASEEAPALMPELRLATPFGSKIEVPGLKESEEAAGSIALVTPLRPSPPKLRTGRSLVLREQIQIAGLEEAPATTPPEESPEAEEVAWVTIAAYFDKKAQYNEMIKAHYAPYRSKAYVVGTDVQRQEVLSSGEFSDWQDVSVGKAMPKLDLRTPVFDDATRELTNKDELRETFAVVKASQATLMQPPFYVVEGGDFWEVPPLVGYEEEEEEQEEEVQERVLPHGDRTAPPPTRVLPPGRSPAGPTGHVGVRRSPGTGRIGGPGPGGATSPPGPYSGATVRSDDQEKREARRQIRLDLKDAEKALGQKHYEEARGLAERVISNQHASKGNVRKAKEIVKVAQRRLERESGLATARASREVGELVTHPETGAVAVWFHDDTVEAGKTYRYRMRVKLWNRYVGRMRVMQDPEQAKEPVVVGDWSYPSEPITVTPSTYFFFSGTRSSDIASVDVWKWRKGRWFKERFDVSVGDVVGGVARNVKTGEYDKEGDETKTNIDFTTGVVVLDLRFDEPVKDRWRGKGGAFSYRDKTSAVMVYLDPADGQVKERVLAFDRRDPTKKELEGEIW